VVEREIRKLYRYSDLPLNFSFRQKISEKTGNPNKRSNIGNHNISKNAPTAAFLYTSLVLARYQNKESRMLSSKMPRLVFELLCPTGSFVMKLIFC
jgi:hypothetical protein